MTFWQFFSRPKLHFMQNIIDDEAVPKHFKVPKPKLHPRHPSLAPKHYVKKKAASEKVPFNQEWIVAQGQ